MVECDGALWKWLNVVAASARECMLLVLQDGACVTGAEMFWMSPAQGGDGNCGCFTNGSLSSCLASAAEARLQELHSEARAHSGSGGGGEAAVARRRGRERVKVPAEIHELFLSDTVPRTGNLPTGEWRADARLVVLGRDLGQYAMTSQVCKRE